MKQLFLKAKPQPLSILGLTTIVRNNFAIILLLSTLHLSALSFDAHSQIPGLKSYTIEISLPDSMNYIKVKATLDFDHFYLAGNDTLKIDLCKGFEGVFFDSLSISAGDKKLNFIIRNDYEIILLPAAKVRNDSSALTFSYTLNKKPGFDEIQFSDFAFQANQNDVHINAAITRADNWIPKLPEDHLKRLPPFSLNVVTPPGYEAMASGKLQNIANERNSRIFAYTNYDEMSDRALYFFINKNMKKEILFPGGFKLAMYLPSDTLQGNPDYLAGMVFKSYRCFEEEYGKTNLNEYKINSFANTTLGYSGFYNSCNAPKWMFTTPIHNNELYAPVRDLIHEVSHTWWGNMVAADAGHDYWLFEGFAKFSEPVFLKTIAGPGIEKLYEKRLKLVVAANIDFIPPLRFGSSDINNQMLKNDAAYYQGALFLLNLKHLVGEENFRKGMQEYVSSNNGKMVNSDDFFKAMQHNAEKKIRKYFYDYLDMPGFAEYTTRIKSMRKRSSYWQIKVEITNTGRKELFTSICRNSDLHQDTAYVYIPEGRGKVIKVKSTKPDTIGLIIVDPDDIFLVRENGMRSPGAKFYTGLDGKLKLINLVEGSPFGKAGLKDNMVIVTIDGQDISNRDIFTPPFHSPAAGHKA
jgi:hypothetical protein